jgi:hypothetical protein
MTTTTIPMNTTEALRQIGRTTVLAVSGGRIHYGLRDAIILPVRYGYAVRITLDAADTYTVERIFTRSGRTTVKGIRTGVYADQLSDTVWAASCYHDEF